jgi:hypothetical protein
MVEFKRDQKGIFFSGGTPQEEDTLESRFPYLGLIGKKGWWDGSTGFSAAEITALGGTPGDIQVQLVRVDSASPSIPTEFDLAWWSDEANAKVTTESDTAGRVAGVFMADLTAVTDQRLTYIAKDGLYPVRFIDSPTVAPDTLGKSAVPSSTDAEADCVTAASMVYTFGRTAGAQVNDAASRLDDTALVSLKIVD